MLTHVVVHPGVDGPLPVVIGLHGHTANARELAGLAPHLTGERALWVLPQGEFPMAGRNRFTWLRLDNQGQRTADEPARTIHALREFIDAVCARYDVDPARVVVLGFSMGAALAYSLALTEPRRFAGLAVLSGYLSEETTLGLDLGEGVEQMPILVQHGRFDPAVPVDHVHESIAQLRARGAQIEYEEYAIGHEMALETVGGLSRWLRRVLRL